MKLLHDQKFMAMLYGLGGAVVIIGALFKLMHWPGGGIMLVLGLTTEALIFTASAFTPPKPEYEWERVYPQLSFDSGGSGSVPSSTVTPEGVLSDKINRMLEAAKVDQDLLVKLGRGIRKFEEAAKNIAPNVETITTTQNYNEQLSLASERVKALNAVYKMQLENTNSQAAINEEITKATGRVKEQMDSFASNLSSLNGIYGGMLSAMDRK
ncbi:gliding motility protein GldL [Elysia marginata]|uniref:Gliding motility protein GldL n=1 Tax=Elysia marginata TaxID=1093978 RepID=A0AAV4GU44_9GAST|nr:gliding motility protein GldL [Elysia marginata]